MSNTRPLLPTFTSAIGMLLGGWAGAAAGSFASHESVVMASYIVGFIGGAICGALVGWRWQARRDAGAIQDDG